MPAVDFVTIASRRATAFGSGPFTADVPKRSKITSYSSPFVPDSIFQPKVSVKEDGGLKYFKTYLYHMGQKPILVSRIQATANEIEEPSAIQTSFSFEESRICARSRAFRGALQRSFAKPARCQPERRVYRGRQETYLASSASTLPEKWTSPILLDPTACVRLCIMLLWERSAAAAISTRC